MATVRGLFLGAKKVEVVGSNQTKKRMFYVDITNGGMYENQAEFQLMGDRVGLVEDYKKGDEIEVSYNIQGRKSEYPDKQTGEIKQGFFQKLAAWKIQKLTRSTAGVPEVKPENLAPVGGDDDLPF